MNVKWTESDPRMWREQCRVGDVAFQHLFCTSKGKPLPDWVKAGLPRMYQVLGENAQLIELLSEYLKMPSLDGHVKRQALRDKLNELVANRKSVD